MNRNVLCVVLGLSALMVVVGGATAIYHAATGRNHSAPPTSTPEVEVVVNDAHGSSDSLTGQGFGYYAVNNVPVMKLSVDQFVASQLTAQGVNVPIPSFLLGADSTGGGGRNMFYNGKNGGNCMSTIGSPTSAFTTAFGGALPMGMSTDSLLKRTARDGHAFVAY